MALAANLSDTSILDYAPSYLAFWLMLAAAPVEDTSGRCFYSRSRSSIALLVEAPQAARGCRGGSRYKRDLSKSYQSCYNETPTLGHSRFLPTASSGCCPFSNLCLCTSLANESRRVKTYTHSISCTKYISCSLSGHRHGRYVSAHTVCVLKAIEGCPS